MWNATQWNQIRYTAYAPIYDRLASPFQRGRRRALALLNIQPTERVLIIGCGTGLDLPLLPTAPAVVATDLTAAMVQRTKARAVQIQRAIGAAVMNGQQLALATASVDVVLLHLTLAVVPDPVACAREVARVIRPGGRVSIYDKFIPDDANISQVRRLVGVVADLAFSDVNRKLGPILEAAGLQAFFDESALLGGTYRIVLARHVQ